MKRINSREAHKENEAYQYDNMIPLGPWTTSSLLHDPIHTAFVLSRYKFVARMLEGKQQVLEIGCGDAPGTPIVAQFTGHVTGIDIDKKIIDIDKKRLAQFKNISFACFDIFEDLPQKTFDAVYSLDVIEHIDPELSERFVERGVRVLGDMGVYIIGTPNITAQHYASTQSKHYHINLQSHTSLRALLEKYFENVFLFSMNDEVVHTGYAPMAHYLFGMGVGLLRKFPQKLF